MRSYSVLIVLNAVLLFRFLTPDVFYKSEVNEVVRYNLPDTNAVAGVSEKPEPFEVLPAPVTDSSFVGFKEALAFKESRGKYHIINTLGYLGKYQFGKVTLNRLNVHNTREFLNNPELQEKAFIALCERHKWLLQDEINTYVGKTIKGIKITESGILAAAHLAGAGSVKRFLKSNGRRSFTDAYGSNLKHYLKRFSGYDTSFIKADKNARV